jgi:hypothetical protein
VFVVIADVVVTVSVKTGALDSSSDISSGPVSILL